MKQLQIYCIWKVIKEGSWPQTFEPCPILCHISVKLGIYLALCVCQTAKIRLIALRFSKILHSMKILWYFESLWLPPCKKTIQISGIEVDWRPMDTHFSIRSWGIYFWVSVSAFLHAPRPNSSSFKSATYMQPSHLTSWNKQWYSQNEPRFSHFMQLKNKSTVKLFGLL